MKKNNKGFTLVELIVVLVILAILAAVLVPALLGYIDKAKKKKDMNSAEAAYIAAQAMCSEWYGTGLPAGKTSIVNLDVTSYVESLTDLESGTFTAKIVSARGDSGKEAFIIKEFLYTDTKSGYTYTWTTGSWTTQD